MTYGKGMRCVCIRVSRGEVYLSTDIINVGKLLTFSDVLLQNLKRCRGDNNICPPQLLLFGNQKREISEFLLSIKKLLSDEIS